MGVIIAGIIVAVVSGVVIKIIDRKFFQEKKDDQS